MAKKKLSKVLAWTLAAAMAVSPVNLTWASESADMFSDNSENTESVEMSADETDSLQQNEQDTQSIVSANEEDTFTAEDAVDVFSAGDASGEGEEAEGEKQIITDVGTLTVKAYEEFIFAPKRNATYRISTDNKEDGIEIMVSSTHGLGTCNYYTMKTGPGHSYPIYIESESEGDITVKVEEVSPIRSISVDDTWKGNFTYPLEQVIADEINPYLPVTVTLEDGKQVSGEYGSYVDGYGKVSVVYEDTDGKLMWDKESGNLNCPRPTTPGTYKYHFFCIADPDITSKAYTVELKSFDELFGKNIVTKEGEAFKVALDKNTYIRRLDRNYLLYHYGFKITPDVDATYYVEINDGLCISVMDEFGGWHREEMWESGSFDMKAGKTYYFTLITEEQLDDQTTVLTIDPVKDVIDKMEWINPPTKKFITDVEDEIGYFNLGIKIRAICKDSTVEEISWGEQNEKLGRMKCSDEVDVNGNRYLRYYFSKNPSVSINFQIEEVSLDDVKDSIPEVKFDKELKITERNFNNCNVFKFKAPENGKYVFGVTGTPVDGIGQAKAKIWIKDKDGADKQYDSSYDIEDGISLDEGDTVYIFAGPYDGDFSVRAFKIQYPSPTGSISIENNTWDSDWPVKNITFTSERAYKNSVKVTVSVQQKSDECGIDKVYYFLASSGKKMSQEELNNLSDSKWTELTETDNTFTLNPGSKYVAYVKITDESGNVTYVLSDGIIVDDTAPKITGITNEKKYCSGISFAVADDVQVKAVTVDGKSVEPDEKGNYIISKSDAEAKHIIVAEDMAGNAVTYKVTVGTKEGHSYLTDPSTDENGWKVIAPATCEKAGNKSRTCKNEGCGFTETESIPALGHDIDFSKNPQFVWEVVPGESLGTIEHYGDVPKYKAKAVFYCKCDAAYVKKTCNVSQYDVMGTNGSYSLLYIASVLMEGKTFKATKTIWLNKVENKNSISTETNIEPGAPDTTVKGLDKDLAESLLTETEKESYSDPNVKTDIKISIKVEDISDTISVDDTKKVEEELNNLTNNMSGNPIYAGVEYFDISMFKNIKIGDSSSSETPISDTGKEITVGVKLSKEAQNVPAGYNRKFYVIRVHGDQVTRLNAKRDGNYLNFDTSKFSTYAIAYVDVKASTPSPSYPSTPSYPVTDVILSQDKADLTKAGETLQLTATVKPSYADNKTITWTSSDEKVATVDKDGKVTAVANGTVTITATSADGKHSAIATITVKIAPEKLTLTAENKTLTKVGETLQITAKIEPDNAYDKLIWKSSDERVATVDVDGKVTAAGNGKAIITATTEDGKLSESVTITVKIPEKPAVNAITGYGNLKARSVTQTNNSIKVEWSRLSGADGYIVYGSQCNGNGKAYKYKKLATITNGKTRTWTHTKLKKATYYKYIVKAYKLVDGKKVITDTSVSVHAVTKGGNYGVAKAVSVTKIGNKKNVTEVILKKGKTAQITAAEVKKDKKIKHHRKLCYESSNPNVATVTAKGMIKAIGKGSCTVWVYAQNGVYKAITVTVK